MQIFSYVLWRHLLYANIYKGRRDIVEAVQSQKKDEDRQTTIHLPGVLESVQSTLANAAAYVEYSLAAAISVSVQMQNMNTFPLFCFTWH